MEPEPGQSWTGSTTLYDPVNNFLKEGRVGAAVEAEICKELEISKLGGSDNPAETRNALQQMRIQNTQ